MTHLQQRIHKALRLETNSSSQIRKPPGHLSEFTLSKQTIK
jgi:hypothetical protein